VSESSGTTTAGSVENGDRESVRLDVPASSGRLRLVRLVVVGFATEHGADVDDLEDIRIATGEVCTHLVHHASDGARLVVEAAVSGHGDATSLSVYASVEGLGDPGPFDDLSGMVLTTTSTEHGVRTDAATTTAWFERMLGSAPPVDPRGGGGRADDG
jgi:serine/threonine-protein kinase RsbW